MSSRTEDNQQSSTSSYPDRIEAGSSIFELIEFTMERTLNDGRKMRGNYGVNVAKVREVLRMPKINPLASRIPEVAGIFELRGVAIPVINLARALGDQDSPVTEAHQIIVTEFSKKRAGFVVSATKRIRRVHWDRVMPPSAESEASITGMTLIENNEFLFILDLERILIDIEAKALGHTTVQPLGMIPTAAEMGQANAATGATSNNGFERGRRTILLADDSKLIITTVKSALVNSGYRVYEATDGMQAFEILQKNALSKTEPRIEAVVSDVEMPRMDGLTLTKKIRGDEALCHLPILLHTSLSGHANQDAGIKVGANGYVVKNNIRDLLELLQELLGSSADTKASA